MQTINPVAGRAVSDAPAHSPTHLSNSSLASGPGLGQVGQGGAPSALGFADLGLSAPMLAALRDEGYVVPTPIQQKAIPHVLAGRDLLGCAQTGTGKTAAFAVPMIERLVASKTPRDARRPRALVLSPTRELSAQIADSFANYGRGTNLKYAVIFGGVGHGPQVAALSRGLDVLVATPGRLLDHMQQGAALLDKVEILVLDEADRMLDMGFLPDVKRILSRLPKTRQTLFFSATMPSDIERLAREILVDPLRVDVAPVSSTAERIEQSVYMVEAADKRRVLERLLRDSAVERAIVFTRTKHGANRLVKELERGEIIAEAIHGNKSQGARQRALDNFRSGRLRVLIATDIAARGIDVDGISHVVNYELPNIPESYVHRIGRTARAGAAGIAISLCSREERAYLRDIERLTRTPIRKLDVPEASADDRARGARPDHANAEARPPRDPGSAARTELDRRPRFQAPGSARTNDASRSAERAGVPGQRGFNDRGSSQARPFDDRRPPPERRVDDRNPSPPRRFDDRAPRPLDARSGPPAPSSHPVSDRRSPAAGNRPAQPKPPELYVRRPR